MQPRMPSPIKVSSQAAPCQKLFNFFHSFPSPPMGCPRCLFHEVNKDDLLLLLFSDIQAVLQRVIRISPLQQPEKERERERLKLAWRKKKKRIKKTSSLLQYLLQFRFFFFFFSPACWMRLYDLELARV